MKPSRAAFRFDGELASKKNAKVPRFGGRCPVCGQGRFLGLIEQPKVMKVQTELATSLVRQMTPLGSFGPEDPLYPSESVEVKLTIDRTGKAVELSVSRICEKPKKNNGRRRDIQNELTLVCDALEQAGVIHNDNQVARIEVTRLVGGEVK